MLSLLTGTIIGAIVVNKKESNRKQKIQNLSDKHLDLFLMMNQWVKIKQEGKKISTYLREKEYKNIAIYGMSYAGVTLTNELKGSEINVLYGIDKNADTIYADINVVSMDDELKQVDAVIVTAITFYNEIEEAITNKLCCPIISLENILYEL